MASIITSCQMTAITVTNSNSSSSSGSSNNETNNKSMRALATSTLMACLWLFQLTPQSPPSRFSPTLPSRAHNEAINLKAANKKINKSRRFVCLSEFHFVYVASEFKNNSIPCCRPAVRASCCCCCYFMLLRIHWKVNLIKLYSEEFHLPAMFALSATAWSCH